MLTDNVSSISVIAIERHHYYHCVPISSSYTYYIRHTIQTSFSPTEPWLHVGYFILGCYGGNYYVNLEQQMVEDINDIRSDRGLPPLLGTRKWIRYDEAGDIKSS